MTTVEIIESRLRERVDPIHVEIQDDSARHAGHRGATSPGGHYRLLVVSKRFEGQTLLERHQLVNDALRDLFGPRIHALSMRTLTPNEWSE